MKKMILIVVLAVVAGTYYGKYEALKEYNSLPGNDNWKIVENVTAADGTCGFKLISAEGREKFYAGSTSEWDIDLETGKCFVY